MEYLKWEKISKCLSCDWNSLPKNPVEFLGFSQRTADVLTECCPACGGEVVRQVGRGVLKYEYSGRWFYKKKASVLSHVEWKKEMAKG